MGVARTKETSGFNGVFAGRVVRLDFLMRGGELMPVYEALRLMIAFAILIISIIKNTDKKR